jgi:hypothetical protein
MLGHGLHADAAAQRQDDVDLANLLGDLVGWYSHSHWRCTVTSATSFRCRRLVAMRSDEAVMAASRAPPAKHTVTQVPQPPPALSRVGDQRLDFCQGFCSATIMFGLQSRIAVYSLLLTTRFSLNGFGPNASTLSVISFVASANCPAAEERD